MWCDSVEGAIFNLSCRRPTGSPAAPGADQGAVDLQPGRIAEGFEMGGGVIEFHGDNLSSSGDVVN